MRTILVPLDGSTLAAIALPYATALARSGGARLVLARSVIVSPLFREDQVAAEAFAADSAEKELEAAAARLRSDGIPAEAHVVYGPAAEGILTAAETVGADLIMMSTHGRGGLGRLVHGSVADAVIRRATTPVLLVPPHAGPATWATATDPTFVLALDGSELAERALPAALDLARQLGASLALLRVVEPLYSRYGYVESLTPYGLVEPDPAEDVAVARAYLESIAAHVREAGVAARIVVEYGATMPSLAEAAERLGALGIVMATHGRAGFARVVLGSVATGLLKQSTVPLLLVHPAPSAGAAEVTGPLEAAGRS